MWTLRLVIFNLSVLEIDDFFLKIAWDEDMHWEREREGETFKRSLFCYLSYLFRDSRVMYYADHCVRQPISVTLDRGKRARFPTHGFPTNLSSNSKRNYRCQKRTSNSLFEATTSLRLKPITRNYWTHPVVLIKGLRDPTGNRNKRAPFPFPHFRKPLKHSHYVCTRLILTSVNLIELPFAGLLRDSDLTLSCSVGFRFSRVKWRFVR